MAGRLPAVIEALDDSLPSKDTHTHGSTGNERGLNTTARDTETSIDQVLAEVKIINVRFNGSLYGESDLIDGEEINMMPNEKVKD
jgi:hypothetical protein